jgi:translation elongation factor EF-Tu-like GTPase
VSGRNTGHDLIRAEKPCAGKAHARFDEGAGQDDQPATLPVDSYIITVSGRGAVYAGRDEAGNMQARQAP